jgi:hypothetical protein
MADVKPGVETSEYKEAKSASTWGIVAAVLGAVITFGGAIAETFGADAKAGIICGAVVAVAGIAQKTLATLGYIKSRTDVKMVAEE